MSSDNAGVWFLPDQAIDNPNRDAFSHKTVAQQLAEAVRGCPPGSVVGLIGEFGTGKSSVAKLVKDLFKNDPGLDVIHVSADKHADVARSRNITHSVGAEMKQLPGVPSIDVDIRLSSLRSTISVTGEAPAPEGVWKLLVGSFGGWPRFLGLAAALALVPVALLLVAAVVDGDGWARAGLATGAAVVAAAATAAILKGLESMLERSLLGPTVQAQTQRAEAADDVEVVFEKLVELHHRSRKGRHLVVFLDDVDRLDRAEVLDALRAIKSLQHVPREKEPTFVVACDENIVRHAIESSRDRPAGDPADEPRTSASEAARAYLDKFFSLRIPLPPHVAPDLRAYVQQAIPEHHPIRHHDIDLELLARVIIHNGVADPRHVIRLLNAFFAAYRLAVLREGAHIGDRRINPGDVSGNPEVLARLTTLRTDFPDFYRHVMTDHDLLVAADQAAQGRLDTSQEALLQKYGYRPSPATGAGENGGTGKTSEQSRAQDRSAAWNPEAEDLRRYLVATVHYVNVPRNLTPFIYLSHSAAGRALGNELLTNILDALDGGDAPRVSDLLSEVPHDQHRATADEIAERLREARELAARNLLAAISPAILQLDGGDIVARAAADLVDRAASVALAGPETLSILLEYASPDQRQVLHRELVRHVEDDAHATDERMRTATLELLREPAPVLRDAVISWLDEIRAAGSWRNFGDAWLDTAEQLGRSADPQLHDDHILTALVGLASETPQLGEPNVERLLHLADGWQPSSPGEEADRVCGLTSRDPDLLRLALGLTARGSLPVTPELAQRLAAASESHAEDPRTLDQVVEELLRDRNWAQSSIPAESEAEDEEPIPLPRHVASVLARTATTSQDSIELAANRLPDFRELLGDEAFTIEQALLTSLEQNREEAAKPEFTRVVGLALIENVERMSEDEVASLVASLLAPLRAETSDPDPEAENATLFANRLIPYEAARTALASEAKTWLAAIQEREPNPDSPISQALQHLRDSGEASLHEPFAASFEQLVGSLPQAQRRTRARTAIAAVPWPPDIAPRALEKAAGFWDELEDSSRSAAISNVPTAARDADTDLPDPVLATLLARIADGDASAARIANDSWGAIPPENRRQALVASATPTSPLRERFRELGIDDAARLFRAASSEGVLSSVLQLVDRDEDLRSEAAEQLLEAWATEDDRRQPGSIDVLVDQLVSERISRFVDTSLTALREAANPGAFVAARSLNRAARKHSVNPPASQVESLIIAKLPEADSDLARELGRLARACGIRDKGDVGSAVKDLGKHGKKAIAEAFRDGLDGR